MKRKKQQEYYFVRYTTALILSWSMSVALFAQQRSRLFGYITDAEKHPVELASVLVSGISKGTVSGPNGFYEVYLPPGDSLEIFVSCVGYLPFRAKILPDFRFAALNVSLQRENHLLSEIEIKAPRLQHSTYQVLDPSRWRALPDPAGGSIEALLTTLPGVHSTNELSSQYSVRGGSYDENSVYVNGVEIYRPFLIRAGQQEGLSFINPDMVESVSFSAGGFTPKYGDKMSSVLDITYKHPESFEGSVSMGLLGASAYVGTSSSRFTQMHGLRYKSNAPLLGSLDTKGQYDPAFLDYQTFLSYRPGNKTEISFLGNVAHDRYHFVPQEQQTSFGTLQTPLQLRTYFDGQEKDLFSTQTGILSFQYHSNNQLKMSLSASVFHTLEEENYDILGQYWLYELVSDSEGKGVPASTVGIGSYLQHARNKLDATVAGLHYAGELRSGVHLMEWGAGVQQEHVNSKIKEWEYRDSAGYALPHTSMLSMFYNLSGNNVLDSYRADGFVQDTYKFRSSAGLWTLTGGFRLNHWSYNREWLISPRFTLAFLPRTGNTVFRFSAGVYYQAPFFKELRDTVSVGGNSVITLNQHLKAQRSLHFIAGIDHSFEHWGRPFKLTAEAYYKPAVDVVPYVVDNVKISYFGGNCAKAYSAGVDFKLFGEFVPGTDSWIGFSLMQSKEKIQTGVDAVGNAVYTNYMPRPNEQRYGVTLFFQDYLPGNKRLKMNLKLIWSDGLPVTAPHNPYQIACRAPDYRRVDLGTSYALIDKDHRPGSRLLSGFKSVWLHFDLFNLLDISNVNSYMWLSDIYGRQYAIPDYLTRRQLNVRIVADF